MRNTFLIAILLAAAVWVGIATEPRPAAADDDKPPQTVLVVYDLRDYLEQIHDYPLNPPPTPPPTTQPATPDTKVANSVFGEPSGPPGSQEELLDEVERLIDSTVQPDSWRDNGGTAGSIIHLDGKLYVTQTPDAQAQVKALLAEVTGDTKRAVHISASWLLLTDDEFADLREPVKPGARDANAPLSDAALAKAKPIARAELLCLNGQTVHITTGMAGIKLQVCPILAANGKEAIVDVLNVVGESDSAAPTTQPAGERFGQQFHTTARIPLGANEIIGGITLLPATGKEPAKEIYVVLRINAE